MAALPIAMIVPQSDFDVLLGCLYAHTTVRTDEIARRLRVSSAQERFACVRFFTSEADARRIVSEIAETAENRVCIRGLRDRLAEIDLDRREADAAYEAGKDSEAASDREAA